MASQGARGFESHPLRCRRGEGRIVLTRLDELLDRCSRIVPVDVDVADRAVELRAEAMRLRMPEALIVATAELDPFVTGNRELARLGGLRCDVRLLVY